MERPSRLVHGMLGGLIAGAVVALWFLVVDSVHGNAFMTPMVLGSAVFEGDVTYASWGVLAAYSALHFAAFAALGVAAAWLLEVMNVRPTWLVGLVFGLLALSALHYTGLLLGGVTAAIVLPPMHVLASNALAGMVLMTYLHYAYHSAKPIGPAALLQYPLVRRGLGVGTVGALAVAAWFLMLDIATGRPFFTPAALGSAFFFGATDPWDVRVTVGLIAAYTAVHLAAFAAIGVAFVLAAQALARVPKRWLMAWMAFVVLEGLFIGTVGAVASWVLAAMGWWAVIIGNVLAVMAMAGGVWFITPDLGRRLRGALVETEV